jgi:hypothetical protein
VGVAPEPPPVEAIVVLGAAQYSGVPSATLSVARRITRVLLVADPFHDERIALMASELGLTPSVSPTRTSPIRGVAAVPYFAKETVEVALGRVIGFRRLVGVS